MSEKSRVIVNISMSNGRYHRGGKPNWWVILGKPSKGRDGSFLTIDEVRGDSNLDVEVDVPVGTEVTAGCGSRQDGVRETLTTTRVKAEVAADIDARCAALGWTRPAKPTDVQDAALRAAWTGLFRACRYGQTKSADEHQATMRRLLDEAAADPVMVRAAKVATLHDEVARLEKELAAAREALARHEAEVNEALRNCDPRQPRLGRPVSTVRATLANLASDAP